MKKSTMFLASAVAAVALFFSTNVNAQSSPKFGIGLNVGVPTSNGGLAIGGDLRYQFDVDKQLSIPLTTGYTNISNNNAGGVSFGYIPLKAGLKYFFNETGGGAYGLGEIGAAFSTNSGGGTSLVYSPAIGYSWSSGFDLAAKYEALSKNGNSNGYVGLRLAYGFKL